MGGDGQIRRITNKATSTSPCHLTTSPANPLKLSRYFMFNFKQDMQCMYNVTLRRVRVTIVAVGKQ